MALKRVSQLPNFNGVPGTGVAGKATLDIPIGPEYADIVVKYKDSGNVNASVGLTGDFGLKINGKLQRQFTLAQLDYINTLYGEAAYQDPNEARLLTLPATSKRSLFKDAANVTHIPIEFAESFRAQTIGGSLGWKTGGLNTFQLEVDVANTATTKTITAEAAVQNAIVTTNGLAQAAPPGKIVKWMRTSVDITGTLRNWQNFWKRDTLLAVHFFDEDITNLQLLADSYEWRNIGVNDNHYRLARFGMTPSDDVFSLVLDYDDVPEGAGLTLNGIQDLRLNITLSDGTARNIPVILELLGDPD